MVGNPNTISESAVDFCLLFTNPAGATRSSLMMARMVALHRALRCLAVPAVPPRMLLTKEFKTSEEMGVPQLLSGGEVFEHYFS